MDRERQTVLIVNDAPDQLALLAVVLDKAGYDTITAGDGEEAYQVATRVRPALVISDVMMPRANGVELTLRLRADARLRATPIILASAHVKDTGTVIEALAAGADEYLEMPFDPLRLVALVTRLLERARVDVAPAT